MAQTQYTGKSLFNAYLTGQMSTWDAYLHATDFEKADTQEKIRLLGYEYGYCAVAVDGKKADAKQHLTSFETHIEALVGKVNPADLMACRSALAAYQSSAGVGNRLSKAYTALKLAKKAYEMAPNDPMVLGLMGNVEFYAPKPLGSKQKALEYYTKAKERYEMLGQDEDNWNYVAVWLGMIQCEDKLGNVTMAVAMADELLRRYPTFKYLKETYLPDLRSRIKWSYDF